MAVDSQSFILHPVQSNANVLVFWLTQFPFSCPVLHFAEKANACWS